MSQTVADFIVERLHSWGISRVYGYSGDGINGVMGALQRAEGKVRLIQTRHEELAAFMACGHAKYTEQPGVVVTTSGPGAIHALNGLYDARKDHMPVVAIVGQQARASLGSSYQQEVDLESLLKGVSEYSQTLTTPAQARHVIDRAVRIACAKRTVTCLVVPNDLQDAPMVNPEPEHGNTFSGIGYRPSVPVPASQDLDAAADILNNGARVAILAGAGVRHAVEPLMLLAERLGAGVAKALLAKTMINDDHPLVTGGLGLLGTEPSDWMMSHCDTLLMVGTSFPYAEFLPHSGKVRCVQIDVDAANLGLRFPTEVNLHGDAAATLEALLPLIQPRGNHEWAESLRGRIERWWELLAERAEAPANPLNPQKVYRELSARLPPDALLACDVGTATDWYARYLRITSRGITGTTSGGLASMGAGVPYALAAKFAYPARPVIAMVGDGAMQMLGNNGLITLAQHWTEWHDPRFIVLVLNNQDLSQVTWEQRAMEGEPKFETSQALPPFEYDNYANMLGLKGVRLDNPDDVGTVWEEAFNSNCPVVINAVVDANVPPLPTHFDFTQVKSYLGSILKGDPESGQMLRQSFRSMAARYLKR
ncbi:MAG: thiamine pyrophosphate-requiring protein [Alteromonadaceae bacterium]|nr:thiamine pyrophosphate-requiring protein [Alteromonadaceae bacterium]